MFQLSYTISPQLRENLLLIESAKRKILIPPLSLQSELELRFQTTVSRIFYTLETDAGRQQIASFLLLHTPGKKANRLRAHEEAIIQYKKGLDFINQYWHVTPKPFTVDDVSHMQHAIFNGRLRMNKENFASLFTYLQSQTESPIIQSGIALSQILRLSPFTKANDQMAHLLALLYLEKGGYDFRGLISIEEALAGDKTKSQAMLYDAANRDNQTLWLEYFTGIFATHLDDVVKKIAKRRLDDGWTNEVPVLDTDTLSDFTQDNLLTLTARQRDIIRALDMPSSRMTNREVQTLFHVSQITASRDLSKLAALGLLFQHGKGRSIYYTRV